MRYYFKLSEDEKRTRDYINGHGLSDIALYPETEEITNDFENNPDSDWWPVWVDDGEHIGDFNSYEDAKEEYIANSSQGIYCLMHDC